MFVVGIFIDWNLFDMVICIGVIIGFFINVLISEFVYFVGYYIFVCEFVCNKWVVVFWSSNLLCFVDSW